MAQLGMVMILAKGRTHGGGEVALCMRSMSSLEQKAEAPSNGPAWNSHDTCRRPNSWGGEVALWMRSIQLLCSEKQHSC